jgi:hypothetical protein
MEVYDFKEMKEQSDALCKYADLIIQDICSEIERLEEDSKRGKKASALISEIRGRVIDWSEQDGK